MAEGAADAVIILDNLNDFTTHFPVIECPLKSCIAYNISVHNLYTLPLRAIIQLLSPSSALIPEIPSISLYCADKALRAKFCVTCRAHLHQRGELVAAQFPIAVKVRNAQHPSPELPLQILQGRSFHGQVYPPHCHRRVRRVLHVQVVIESMIRR